jgi:flagellar assembly protein FliH
MSRITAERWALPSVDGPIVGGKRVDEAKREEQERAEREVLHSRGYEDGLAAGQAEIAARVAQLDARIQRLDAALQMLAKPLEQLDDEVQQQLSQLALTVGKQIARRELKADPAQIIAIIREAVARLPAAARDVRVHLHPEDAAIVRERLSSPGSDRAWNVIEDPALTQGGCLVRTDTSQIDARLESRLNAIVSSILGDERAPGRTDSQPPASSAPEESGE